MSLNTGLIALIAFLPALAWILLWRLQDKEKEPLKAMLWCFGLGALGALPLLFGKDLILNTMNGWPQWGQILSLAAAEEIIKAVMVVAAIEISHRWFTQLVDGLIYGSAVALGFAFAENLLYLADLTQSSSALVLVFLIRSLNTMVAHSLFTALFGFLYANAYLDDKVFPKKKREKPWYHFTQNLWEALPLHVTLTHILPNRPSKHGHYPGSLILEGILIATLLHALFNGLLQIQWQGTNLSFLTFPLVVGMAYLCWRLFLASIYTKMVRAVKG